MANIASQNLYYPTKPFVLIPKRNYRRDILEALSIKKNTLYDNSPPKWFKYLN